MLTKKKKFTITPFGTKIAILASLLIATVIAACSSYIISQKNQLKETGLFEKQQLEKQQLVSRIGAKAISHVISAAVDSGKFTMNDIFDPEYVPIPNTEPPQYHTKYDSYLDKAIVDLQDEFLTDSTVHFAIAVDQNGYIPTHNTVATGNNETKRIINDPIIIKSTKNITYGYTQTSNSNTDEERWSISSPIIVKGKQWGAFCINVSPAKAEIKTNSFNTAIIIIMTFIFLIVTATMFALVIILPKEILAPIALLTKQTAALADGEVDNKIDSSSLNEISELSNAIERLRVSLKLAMDRLNR